MSSKPVAMNDSNCLVPVVLLCAICVSASFSCLFYAIAARGDIDALNGRLAALESRSGCDTRVPQPASQNSRQDRSTQEGGALSSRFPTNVASSGRILLGRRISDTFPSPGNWLLKSNGVKRNLTSGEASASDSLHVVKREPSTAIHPTRLLHQVGEQRTSPSASSTKNSKSDVIYDGAHEPQRDSGNFSETKIRLKRSPPQNREFRNEDDVEDISRGDRRLRGRRRGGGREETVIRSGPRMTGGPQTLALHFDGDASKYTLGHRHYEGNGRLRHPDGIFRDWRLKDWSGRFERHFRLQENDGELTIRDSGIYFVYAQVYYLDDHDVNGFRVLVNDSPVLQCTVMSHGGSLPKSNTCFTGGMVELQTGDNIVIRDLAALRYSIFESGKSFFGLFRVTHHSTVAREGP